MTPRQSVESECGRSGTEGVVSRCIAVLSHREVDAAFVVAIGGPGAQGVLDGRAGGTEGYWPRVWAARALLYAWQDRATPVVLGAAADESWRVREMAAKVIARHRLDAAFAVVDDLLDDPHARVRSAAARARRRLTEAGR
jgi:HEAT repeats